jgi:hypothetical protein
MFVTADMNPYEYSNTGNGTTTYKFSEKFDGDMNIIVLEAGGCLYYLDIYPTEALYYSYQTNRPSSYTSVIAMIFFAMIMTFFIFNWFIQQRNKKVVMTAARSNAIVAAMFPTSVRERLFNSDEGETRSGKRHLAATTGLKDFLAGGDKQDLDEDFVYKSKPIADLFPEVSVLWYIDSMTEYTSGSTFSLYLYARHVCIRIQTTVMFADIVGFTAWSSVREPSQVFTLLETVYRAFDLIARNRRVLKVETVGDCYVAVAGLPEPRKDHAVVMVRFAQECLQRTDELTKKLEVVLGPDTADL